MSRRKKKEYPPGTFLPTSQRVLAIVQLCIAFTLIMWYVGQPFMGEYFRLRSRLILYEYVLGTSDKGKLADNSERFEILPFQLKQIIINDHRNLHDYAKRSFLSKINDGFKVLFLEIPAFEVAWIFFSIVIAILLLKKVEGARHAVWILPVLVLGYAIDNRLGGISQQVSPDRILFPTEQMILKEPLSNDPVQQYSQLQKGWENYLVEHWLPKNSRPANPVEEAEFHFTVARLNLLHGQMPSDRLPSYRERSSPLLLILFMIWNLFFARMMNRKLIEMY